MSIIAYTAGGHTVAVLPTVVAVTVVAAHLMEVADTVAVLLMEAADTVVGAHLMVVADTAVAVATGAINKY